MRKLFSVFADPMIGVLALAVFLSLIVPAAGPARDVWQDVANGAIFVLFFVSGLRVSRSEVARGLRHWRYFLPLFAWVFLVMPALGMMLQMLCGTRIPPEIALGFLFLGTLPSTVQSATTYTTLAGGSIAVAVIGAAVLNIAGVFVSAPLFALLEGGASVAVGTDTIWRIAQLLILPFALGQIAQGWLGGIAARHRDASKWLDRAVIGIAVYVAFSGAVEEGIGALAAQDWVWLAGLVALYLASAHAGAWLAGGLLGLPRPDRVAFLFAGAQKSIAIGAPLAALIFPPERAGFVIAPLLLYHLAQLVIAAPIAGRLARSTISQPPLRAG
ncbi:bile acid:sodium symporter [Erythrobacter sp. LQ02-29]|uniref:bile acid:sodium symporter family protein n=1 Tax=Erythrobacter sp. LQ02-29 TaxID=2920384 RepID=UPI001F4EE64F|nr:bile acid:sodium symporter family protein [Erythrobacter sp. LQ02-29]MCP9223369.1 bile acid:sodium symporter [Erythrobacter sp. LQ02-29]